MSDQLTLRCWAEEVPDRLLSIPVNVVTVEDPIEYRLPGIVQVPVHERAVLNFDAALRSIVRRDPDVIFVDARVARDFWPIL